MSLDESSVIGRISKQWTGFEAEAFTDADNFGLQFPMDLDIKIKAVILGACFLIVSNRCSSLIFFYFIMYELSYQLLRIVLIVNQTYLCVKPFLGSN